MTISELPNNYQSLSTPFSNLSLDQELKHYHLELEKKLDHVFKNSKNLPPSKIETEEEFQQRFPKESKFTRTIWWILKKWGYLEIRPSQSTLAKLAKCSRKTANLTVKRLVELGVLKKHYRHRKTCRYFIPQFLRKVTTYFPKKKRGSYREKKGNVTPYRFSTTDDINLLKKKHQRSPIFQKKKFKKPPIPLPSYIPQAKVLVEQVPELSNMTKFEYWKFHCFAERAFFGALEALQYAISKGRDILNPISYMFKVMYALDSSPKWRLYYQILENKGISAA